ncbi:MAG TPA: hypothetical protein VMU07_01715 [Candidatus Paceibacterota bacterium]|nr:hypothetical protein [Candidatus Paceibacterota bacterium]
METSQLREFISRSLSHRVTKIIDRPTNACENFVEGFVLETNGKVTNELLLILFQRFYTGARITPISEIFNWISRKDKPTLLITITNLSDSPHGSKHFGGTTENGAIGFEITQHPSLKQWLVERHDPNVRTCPICGNPLADLKQEHRGKPLIGCMSCNQSFVSSGADGRGFEWIFEVKPWSLMSHV